jgi:TusA-related sulfurtransferase
MSKIPQGLPARGAGTAFLEAVTARRFGEARALLADDVRFRMLVPNGLMTEDDAESTVGRFVSWFADADSFEVEASTTGEVAGRLECVYRVRLHDAHGWRLIEQHLMLDIDTHQRIAAIDLLCSGFRPIATAEPGGVHHFDAGNLGCADGLAGEFRRQMQQIPVGHVLVVSAQDPAAQEDLPPLARLMGHVVRSVEAPDDGRLLITVERGR